MPELSDFAKMLIPIGGNILGSVFDGMNTRAARNYSSIDMQLERLRKAGLPLSTLLGSGYSEQSPQPKEVNLGASEGIQAYQLSQMQAKQQQVMDKQIEELDLRIQQLQRDKIRDVEKLNNVDMFTGNDTLIQPGDSGIVREARRARTGLAVDNIIKNNEELKQQVDLDVQRIFRDINLEQFKKGNLSAMEDAKLDRMLSENRNIKKLWESINADIKNKSADLLLKGQQLSLQNQAYRMGELQIGGLKQDIAHQKNMYPIIEGMAGENLSFTKFMNALKYSVKESLDEGTGATIPFLGKVTQAISDGLYLYLLKAIQLPDVPQTQQRTYNTYNTVKTN